MSDWITSTSKITQQLFGAMVFEELICVVFMWYKRRNIPSRVTQSALVHSADNRWQHVSVPTHLFLERLEQVEFHAAGRSNIIELVLIIKSTFIFFPYSSLISEGEKIVECN